MGWQWHQLDHVQIISTSLQTDNHASTSSLNFLQAGCASWRPANSVKAVKTNTDKVREWVSKCFFPVPAHLGWPGIKWVACVKWNQYLPDVMSTRSLVLLMIASAFSLVMSPCFTHIFTGPAVSTCDRASNDTSPASAYTCEPKQPTEHTQTHTPVRM